MEYTQESLRELAERIYDLDAEVYTRLGSSLGRVFNRDRERCVTEIVQLMMQRDSGHQLRSELALISNMARTIPDKESRSMIMREYTSILHEIIALPTSFGGGDVLDQNMASLNALNLEHRFSGNDHLVICISRTQGSAGNDIGFGLADKLRINYYDVEIFDQVLRRLEAEKGAVNDAEYFADFNKYEKKHKFDLKGWFREFNRYHGLPKQDAVFFNMSDLICDLASKEDCIIMGRCADAILKNNHVPHISLFITAPFAIRVQHVMDVRKMNMKQAVRFLKKMDSQHRQYYNFYGGAQWGKPDNYDLCINSASYGINETENLILKLLDDQIH